MSVQDTIVAPATPSGQSALAVIRLSGPLASHIASAALGHNTPRARQATLATYSAIDAGIIDNIIYIYYVEGRSYTGDSMLEFMPHGNPYVLTQILEDLIARGCRLADPGEFTRRAFLNGKMDLSQAEAVQQFIQARSENALENARRQLDGSIGRLMGDLAARMTAVTASLEAYIDFPEEDLPTEDHSGPIQELKLLIIELARIAATSATTSLMHEGARCVIVGEPNAGKSSLLNAMTGDDRSIVSELPGTTRDYLEEAIRIGPHLCRLIDTAGLHETTDSIESAGIQHTFKQLNKADIILLMLDATLPYPTLPRQLLQVIQPGNTLLILNKVDLCPAPEPPSELIKLPCCKVSATTLQGLPALNEKLIELLDTKITAPGEASVLVSARHAAALRKAGKNLQDALVKIDAGIPIELAASDMRDALDAIGEITGRIDNESVLDALFKGFCIGK